jgi:hypothetical protein
VWLSFTGSGNGSSLNINNDDGLRISQVHFGTEKLPLSSILSSALDQKKKRRAHEILLYDLV